MRTKRSNPKNSTRAKGAKRKPNASFLEALGAAIKEIRREQGLHQDQLGARAGVPGSRIGEIERAVVSTSVARIAAIAEALGMSMVALLQRAELIRRASLVAAGERDDDPVRSRAIDNLRRLDPADADLAAQLLARFKREPK